MFKADERDNRLRRVNNDLFYGNRRNTFIKVIKSYFYIKGKNNLEYCLFIYLFTVDLR